MERVVMGKYDKYVITRPQLVENLAYHGKRAEPFTFYVTKELIPEANYYMDISWRTKVPTPNPTCVLHIHDVIQILLFTGEPGSFEVVVPLVAPRDPVIDQLTARPEDEYKVDRTAAIYIPPNVRHNVKYLRIDGPMAEIGMTMRGTYP